MRLWTYGELRDKVQEDLDLECEIFITPKEMLGYVNEGIGEVEAIIHTLYEDYYLTKDFIPLTTGVQEYPFPADIYAMKVRTFTYGNGTEKYEITKWRESLAGIQDIGDSEPYRYIPFNSTLGGYTLMLLPASREDSLTNATLWYIRGAARLVLETDLCDLPELAINYLIQFVKQRCYEKEPHPNVLKAVADTDKLMVKMVETLKNMVDDENDTLRKDTSFYDDFD